MVVALLAGSKVNLVAEPAAKRQPYTRAIRTVPENFDGTDFPVFLDLPFYGFEWHELILPRPIKSVQQNSCCHKVFYTVKQRRASVRASRCST